MAAPLEGAAVGPCGGFAVQYAKGAKHGNQPCQPPDAPSPLQPGYVLWAVLAVDPPGKAAPAGVCGFACYRPWFPRYGGLEPPGVRVSPGSGMGESAPDYEQSF